MAEQLTAQQKQAVEHRGGRLLVSAAAGSGKTKVLVDRLLRYLDDPVKPANIDDFLIITYTKAAASELRGKIAKRLTDAVAANPDNRHLQHQLQRLYLTKISTVHAFCTDILREYAYRLDISADFRVADEDECFALMSRVLQQILDSAYDQADQDPDFCAFIDSQGFGRDDRQIPDIMMKVYSSARCHLNPEKWLDWCISVGETNGAADASETPWGEYLIADLHRYLDLQMKTLNRGISCLDAGSCPKVVDLLGKTLDQLSVLRSCKTWDSIVENSDIDYGRLTFPTKFDEPELKEQIKTIRDNCKKGLGKRLRRFTMNSAQLLSDIAQNQSAVRGLIALVRRFDKAYADAKRSRRVLDFGDLEHKTLDLLTGKDRNCITKIADEIGERFREVMVDEYQDTNAVQDAIFSALTFKKRNCFMVGDVKQSIYQFRLADPGIFLEKYETYSSEGTSEDKGRKILLSSNFRSAGNVISAVNDVFSVCMSKEVGGLIYGDDEKLNEGVLHPENTEREVELYAIEGNDDVYAYEAGFVADKIVSLLDGTHMVRSKDGFRPICAEDIAILLRSPGSVGGVYQSALELRGVRCVSGGTVDMLQTEEIEVLRSFMQVIHNPLQDIPLLSVLTSRVIGFTANEIAQIRGKSKYTSMFQALEKSDHPKVCEFMKLLNVLRGEAQMSNLAQLLMVILSQTHMDSIYSAMPDGVDRCENLQNFCKLASSYEASVGGGLNRFLEHLTILENRGVDVAVEPNGENAVQIMSIHKSKGLEFPVVFLCGLSRDFNMESARAQVLCDKHFGLGLACVDKRNAVRYPTLAKQAIAQKIMAESISEEMRVLYVAMTRAQDRLIMTYTEKNVAEKLEKKRYSVGISQQEQLTMDADCFGDWILQTAFTKGGDFWRVIPGDIAEREMDVAPQTAVKRLSEEKIRHINRNLHFVYPFQPATQTPSKQTATQMKGRRKDAEASEQAQQREFVAPSWRKPSFISKDVSGSVYGNLLHRVMCYVRLAQCDSLLGIEAEIQRLVEQKCITREEGAMLNVQSILDFFQTDIGAMVRTHPNVIREFKFSILDDAGNYCDGVDDEKILLQGVVDCALIFEDSITVLDFKTDRVLGGDVEAAAQKYKNQIQTYATALSRIYEKPVRSALLYFFHTGSFVKVI